MSAATPLPFDFIDYLCLARGIERDVALELLAKSVRELAHPTAAREPSACASSELGNPDFDAGTGKA